MSNIRLATVLALPCAAVLLSGAVTAQVTAQSRFAQPPQQQQQQTVMRFSEMDDNDDGVITRDEWRGTRQAWMAADLNRDGVLAGREIWVPAGNGNQTRAPGDFDLTLGGNAADQSDAIERFNFLDANRNGRVELREWRGTAQSFAALDRNGDNVLTEAEATGATGTTDAADSIAARRAQFQNLDSDRDDVVRFNEWNGNRGSFNRQDLNRDGVITRREYVGIEAAATAPPAAGAARRQARRAQQVIRINPQMRWTDTGVYVNAGDVLVLDSIGTTQLSDNDADVAAPAGSRSGRKAVDSPLPNELAGALIGRIGDSAPFGVGNLKLLQAPATGMLFLGVNDDHLADNRGEFQVSVSIR